MTKPIAPNPHAGPLATSPKTKLERDLMFGRVKVPPHEKPKTD